MRIRVVGLALPAVIGVTVAVTSCGSAPVTAKPGASATPSASRSAVSSSPTASPAASGSPAPVPAGYKRIGGAAQGISLGVPTSWVAVDLAKVNAQAAASKISINGMSSASLVQDMEELQKLHAVAVWDVNSAQDSPQHFARNLNAYCFHGAVGVEVGAAGVPALKAAVSGQLGSQGVAHVTQQDLTIGGTPGVETSYQQTSTAGTVYGAQLEVVPKPDDVCVVTESFGSGQSGGSVLRVAAATAAFP